MTNDDLTPAQWQAIALTLDDLEGWGTLHGEIHNFDTATGEPFDSPRKVVVGEYDRQPRRSLPECWITLFIDRGWLDAVHLANGWTVWKPTAAGREVAQRWLPDRIKTSRTT